MGSAMAKVSSWGHEDTVVPGGISSGDFRSESSKDDRNQGSERVGEMGGHGIPGSGSSRSRGMKYEGRNKGRNTDLSCPSVARSLPPRTQPAVSSRRAASQTQPVCIPTATQTETGHWSTRFPSTSLTWLHHRPPALQ